MAAQDAGFVFATSKGEPAAPGYVSYGPYSMTADAGLTKRKKGKGGIVLTDWISAPFEVLGACRNPNGRAWGKQLVLLRDADSRVHLHHLRMLRSMAIQRRLRRLR